MAEIYQPVVIGLLSEIYKALASGRSITGLITQGTNVTITGTGTTLDPYVISSAASGANITIVANYSALPDPTTVSGKFYWCSASQGVKYIGALFGGTYYNSGLYYSNGVSWEYMETPYQATQAGVNAGVITDQFVTPRTLSTVSQNGSYIYVTTGGSTTAYTASFTPTILVLTTGMELNINVNAANTTATPTINIDTLGAKNILNKDGNAIAVGDFSGQTKIRYDGTSFRIVGGSAVPTASPTVPGIAKLYTSLGTNTDGSIDQNTVNTNFNLKANLASPTLTGTPAAPTASAGTNTTQLATTAFVTGAIQGNALGYATATGTNTYTASLTPALPAYATGQMFEIVFTNANTSASTINLNSLGAKSLVKNGSSALISADISAGQAYSVFYDGINFQLLSKVFNVAGSNTQIQYNDSGTQAGSADFLWSKTASNLMLGASAVVKGWLNIGASTATKPHMNLLDGVTTTDTTNGNFWRVGVDWFFRSASYVAKNMWQDQPNSALSGTGTVVGQLDLNGTWSRGNTITPFGNFSQINSVTINTTSKTSIYLADGAGSKTIPTTYWAVGKVTYSEHYALVTTAASAGTAQFIVYIGGTSGTLLVDTGAITLPNSVTNQGFCAKVKTTCITTGASGSLISAIELYLNTTLIGIFVGVAIAGINLSGSLDYEVTLTLSAGSSTNKFVFNQGEGGYKN